MRSVVCAIAVLVSAVAVSACGVPGVRELDRKNAKMTIPERRGDQVTEIKTPEELAKSPFFVDDASREAIRKQMNFSKEKIVIVTWWGSSTSWVIVLSSEDGKKVVFHVATGNPALADMRPHIHAFAVPKDMPVETALGRLKELLDEKAAEIIKLSLKDVKVAREMNTVPPRAIVIKSADELAKAKLFADDASRDVINKQIDFTKHKLVLFVWEGSGGDKIAASLSKDGKTAEFTYTRGETDDLRDHALAFAVPKDCEVKVGK